MFMDFLGYGNHVSLFSEEISAGGEGLGVSGSFQARKRWGEDSDLAEYPSGVLTCYPYFGGFQLGPNAQRGQDLAGGSVGASRR
jgi:hypothetical protein